jgi:hypothetical protein
MPRSAAHCRRMSTLEGSAVIFQTVSSSTLAIWNGKRKYAPRLSAQHGRRIRGTYALPLRSWQEGSQCSELGYSLGILARPSGGALSVACPPRLLAVVGGDCGLRSSETFCGLPAHTDPQKVSQAFVNPLTGALCQIPKWLKSSSTHSGE